MNLINFALAQNINSPLALTEFIQAYCTIGANLSFCLQGIYNLLVALAVAVAFFSFLIGVFENLLSTIPDVKLQGKNRMKNAMIGLAVIFISGVFLYWINPSIFNARLIIYKIDFTTQAITITQEVENLDEAPVSPPETIKIPPTQKELIETQKQIEKDLVPIPAKKFGFSTIFLKLQALVRGEKMFPGSLKNNLFISPSAYALIHKDALNPLLTAADIAAQKNYNLLITSAYRPLEKQRQLFENKVTEIMRERGVSREEAEKLAKVRVAKPGYSAHNFGKAVDIFLCAPENGYCKKYGPKVDFDNQNSLKRRKLCGPELDAIMCTAGWVRYEKECWHFEYGTKRWERGRSKGSCVE